MPNPLVVRTSAGSRPQANLEMKDLSFLLGHSRSELGSYELQRLSSVTNLRRDLFGVVVKHCRKGKRGGVPILRSSHLRDAGAPGSSRRLDSRLCWPQSCSCLCRRKHNLLRCRLAGLWLRRAGPFHCCRESCRLPRLDPTLRQRCRRRIQK
jgi:hypothetical protein